MRPYEKEDVQGEILRLADYNVPAGVLSDEGDGDEWPSIRQKVMQCDILLLGTPIWVGQPSSLVKRAMEPMDAFYDETDAEGRMPSYGKVCALAVVGNEDGAHNVAGSVFQGLNDLGFTLPASGMTYWVGEAMSDSEYKNLRKTPKAVEQATTTMVKNAVHPPASFRSRTIRLKEDLRSATPCWVFALGRNARPPPSKPSLCPSAVYSAPYPSCLTDDESRPNLRRASAVFI